MMCYPYSNIGNGVEFECDFDKQYFTDLIDNCPATDTARRHCKKNNKVNFYSDNEESDAESEIAGSDKEESVETQSESEVDDESLEDDHSLNDVEYIEAEERLQSEMIKVKKEGNNELLPLTNCSRDNFFYSGNDEERLVTKVKVNECTSFFKPENVPESSRVNNIRQCENNNDIDEEDNREDNEDNTESEEEKVVLRDMLSTWNFNG